MEPLLELRLPAGREGCGSWLRQRPPEVVATLLDAVELLYMGFMRSSEDESCRAVRELGEARAQLLELDGLRAEVQASAPRLARQAWQAEENDRLRAELAAREDVQQQLRLRLEAAQHELGRLLTAAQPPPRSARPVLPFLRREAVASPASSRLSSVWQEQQSLSTWRPQTAPPQAARRARRTSGLRR